MINLSNVTFNIPVKIDAPERLENLKLAIDYLYHHFETNIIVYEVANSTPVYIDRDPRVIYIFKAIGNGPFHRTQYLNEMAVISKTPIIVNYDCDVLLPPQNYNYARGILEANNFCGVFPYDGLFVNVPRQHIPEIRKNFDLSFIDVEKTENFGKGSVGGALFWNKEKFIAGGMENENFVSWGCEDWERIKRFNRLGFKFTRVEGPLFHISHPRGNDSCESNPYYKNNQALYDKIANMNPIETLKYIKSQPWIQALNRQ